VTCLTCAHPERARIELLLAGGASARALGRKYCINHNSLHRHWVNHVGEERKINLAIGPVERQALAARLGEEAKSVLDHHKITRAGLLQLYTAALEAGDLNGGATLAGRLTEVNNAIGKLTGEILSSPFIANTTNIFVSPQFVELEQALVRALAAHPAARGDVIKALRDLEARSSQPALPPPIEHEAVTDG
jgi:hypothetical protein